MWYLQSFQWMSRVLQAVDSIHQVGIYCLALVPPNYLPKTPLGGIHLSETKRRFLEGTLHPANVLLCPHTCVTNLPKPREVHSGMLLIQPITCYCFCLHFVFKSEWSWRSQIIYKSKKTKGINYILQVKVWLFYYSAIMLGILYCLWYISYGWYFMNWFCSCGLYIMVIRVMFLFASVPSHHPH